MRFFLCFNFFLTLLIEKSFASRWEWIGGTSDTWIKPLYSKNVSDNPFVGSRIWPIYFLEGNMIFVFGGHTHGGSGTYHDLWSANLTANGWKWLSGSSSAKSPGIYAPSSGSPYPGSRKNSGGASGDGVLYIFGGMGFDVNTIEDRLSDLWQYDIAGDVWKWLGGSSSALTLPRYGTKGTESATTVPGARASCKLEYGGDGLLFLFGGNGKDTDDYNGMLNDFFSFNINSMKWTWISGSTLRSAKGVYGTRGIEDASNIPGARQSPGFRIDDTMLYLFGGKGFAVGAAQDLLNDLWTFNMTSRMWSWIAGTSVLKQKTTSSLPGGRQACEVVVAYKDVYVYGGNGLDGTNDYYANELSDFWMYQSRVDKWKLLSGEILRARKAVYSPSDSTSVGAKSKYIMGMVDSAVYLFGGYGCNHIYCGRGISDMWKYEIQAPEPTVSPSYAPTPTPTGMPSSTPTAVPSTSPTSFEMNSNEAGFVKSCLVTAVLLLVFVDV